nr:MAG TPA: hypothetical protein [Caudoviricetes sp.]
MVNTYNLSPTLCAHRKSIFFLFSSISFVC